MLLNILIIFFERLGLHFTQNDVDHKKLQFSLFSKSFFRTVFISLYVLLILSHSFKNVSKFGLFLRFSGHNRFKSVSRRRSWCPPGQTKIPSFLFDVGHDLVVLDVADRPGRHPELLNAVQSDTPAEGHV